METAYKLLLREVRTLRESYRAEAAELESTAEERGPEMEAEAYGRLRGRQHACEDVDHALGVILARSE